MTGDCEEDVLSAVVLDGGLAGEGRGRESEDAGGGESGEVHDCGVEFEQVGGCGFGLIGGLCR